jgi:hypothetical protein
LDRAATGIGSSIIQRKYNGKTPFSEKRVHLVMVFSFKKEIYNDLTAVCLYSVAVCSIQTLISGKQGINLKKSVT